MNQLHSSPPNRPSRSIAGNITANWRWLQLCLFSAILSLTAFVCAANRPVNASEEVTDRSKISAKFRTFDVERLPPPLQQKGKEILRNMLDHEAIYTLFGSIKSMSSGFWNYQFNEQKPDMAPIDQMRQILECFCCDGQYHAEVLIFAKAFQGKKFAEGFIFHLPSLRRTLRQHAPFFKTLGLTAHSHPHDILEAVENASSISRFRGYGILFGYPEYAVDFFADAAQKQEDGEEFVARDFFSIPTAKKVTGAFVWATPKGHIANDSDRWLQSRAQAILSHYELLLSKHNSPDDSLPTGLLLDIQDWAAAQYSADIEWGNLEQGVSIFEGNAFEGNSFEGSVSQCPEGILRIKTALSSSGLTGVAPGKCGGVSSRSKPRKNVAALRTGFFRGVTKQSGYSQVPGITPTLFPYCCACAIELQEGFIASDFNRGETK